MPFYWIFLFVTFGLLSLLTLSIIPLLVVVGLWALCQPVEQPLRDEIMEAGLNPDAPPPPTSLSGCMALLVWVLVVIAGVLLVVGLSGLLLHDWGVL